MPSTDFDHSSSGRGSDTNRLVIYHIIGFQSIWSVMVKTVYLWQHRRYSDCLEKLEYWTCNVWFIIELSKTGKANFIFWTRLSEKTTIELLNGFLGTLCLLIKLLNWLDHRTFHRFYSMIDTKGQSLKFNYAPVSSAWAWSTHNISSVFYVYKRTRSNKLYQKIN